MPRKRTVRAQKGGEEEFQTPSPLGNATNYSFDYSSRSSRIINPNQPSSSAAPRQENVRKSTSHAPHGRNAPIREHLSRSESNVESPPERRSTRNLGRAGQNTKHSHRRKQKNPLSTEFRMMREIKRLQDQIGCLIPRAPFGRLIREVMMDHSREITMITRTALEGIQEACEIYLVQVLSDAYALTLHRGRVTLMPKDIHILRVLRLIE